MKSLIWLYRAGHKPMASKQHLAIREILQEHGYQIRVHPWQDRAFWRHQHTCDWLIWSFIPTQFDVWASRMQARHQMVVLHELPASVSRLPDVDHWLVASESLRLFCLDSGIHPDKITVGTAYPATHLTPTSEIPNQYKIDSHSPLIYVGGPMQTPQGNRLAIWALSILQYLHPQVRMILHGCGEATSSIELWMEGIVDGKAVYQESADTPVQELVSQCDAVWLPRETDGVPDALFAGLNTGKLILASRQPSLMEWISHDQNGILIENQHAPTWAAAMHRLLQDQARAQRIASQAALTPLTLTPVLPRCLNQPAVDWSISAA